MTPPIVTVRIVVPSEIPDRTAALTAEELRRAFSFRFEKDRVSWTGCRSALRRTLGGLLGISPGDVPIAIGEHGKPELPPPFDHLHFNLSHCDDLALIIAGSAEVGIDIEPLNRGMALIGCEESFCHPNEIADLPGPQQTRAEQLIRIWTAKEAALKAIGTGLLHPPTGIQIDFKSGEAIADQPVRGLDRIRLTQLDHPSLQNHSAFAATHDSLGDIYFVD